MASAGVNVAARLRKIDANAGPAPATDSWTGIFGNLSVGKFGAFIGDPSQSPVWVGVSVGIGASTSKGGGSLTNYEKLDPAS